MKSKGCQGAIVQGWVRDYQHLNNLDFPVWAKGYIPHDASDIWNIYETMGEIVIGNIFITPEDYIFADVDGVMVIKGHLIDDFEFVINDKIDSEDKIREQLSYGLGASEATEKFGEW